MPRAQRRTQRGRSKGVASPSRRKSWRKRGRQELNDTKKSEQESRAGCSMAQELARERSVALNEERSKREEAEQAKRKAERERGQVEARQRKLEERNREMRDELTRLQAAGKKLRKETSKLWRAAAGVPVGTETTQSVPEEGSIRNLEDEHAGKACGDGDVQDVQNAPEAEG